jgi:hypothetical protein
LLKQKAFSLKYTKSKSYDDIALRKCFELASPGSIQSCSSMMTSGIRSSQPKSPEKSSSSPPSMSILRISGEYFSGGKSSRICGTETTLTS